MPLGVSATWRSTRDLYRSAAKGGEAVRHVSDETELDTPAQRDLLQRSPLVLLHQLRPEQLVKREDRPRHQSTPPSELSQRAARAFVEVGVKMRKGHRRARVAL